MEWIIIALISLGCGFATVEYQKARTDPPAFQSPEKSDAPFITGIKINGKDARV